MWRRATWHGETEIHTWLLTYLLTCLLAEYVHTYEAGHYVQRTLGVLCHYECMYVWMLFFSPWHGGTVVRRVERESHRSIVSEFSGCGGTVCDQRDSMYVFLWARLVVVIWRVCSGLCITLGEEEVRQFWGVDLTEGCQ